MGELQDNWRVRVHAYVHSYVHALGAQMRNVLKWKAIGNSLLSDLYYRQLQWNDVGNAI